MSFKKDDDYVLLCNLVGFSNFVSMIWQENTEGGLIIELKHQTSRVQYESSTTILKV